MGSHFFDRFTGRLGRHGGGHGNRSKEAWPTEQRQQPTRVLVCPRCWADNTPDARFCGACGNAFAPARAATCTGCGNALATDAKFCSSCGQAATGRKAD